ncbi:MAG: NnrU family protein [Gammaproteobacteria bacterium]|nr:NnrU family protein [Gammaproteobacteria bacterium]
MIELVLAAVLFLVTHLGISSTPMRGALVAKIGERPYLGVYSLLAAVTIAYLIMTYLRTPQFQYLWGPSPALKWVPVVAMPVALVLFVGGFMVRNPTAVGLEGSIADAPRGVLRVTRHPFQWSIVLWSSAHIIANGDVASLVFFGAFGLLSACGSVLLDRKKAKQLGDAWAGFTSTTSNVPFGAIASGRNRLVVGELWLPVAIGLAAYVLVLFGHEWISGVAIF